MITINKRIYLLLIINVLSVLILFSIFNSYYKYNQNVSSKVTINITQNKNTLYENKFFFLRQEISLLKLEFFNECFQKKYNYPYSLNPYIQEQYRNICVDDWNIISSLMSEISDFQSMPKDEEDMTQHIFYKINEELLSPNNIFTKNSFLLKEFHVNPYFFNFIFLKGANKEIEFKSLLNQIINSYKINIYGKILSDCELLKELKYCTKEFLQFINKFNDTINLDYLINGNFIKFESKDDLSINDSKSLNGKNLLITPVTFWFLIISIFPFINLIIIYIYKNYQIKKINN